MKEWLFERARRRTAVGQPFDRARDESVELMHAQVEFSNLSRAREEVLVLTHAQAESVNFAPRSRAESASLLDVVGSSVSHIYPKARSESIGLTDNVQKIATFQWAVPVGGGAPTSYSIHWGTSTGTYSNSLNVGNVTTYPLASIALSQGTTYFMAARATNAAGVSPFSNEIRVLNGAQL